MILVLYIIPLQDGALLVTESLFHGIEEFVKLDLSYCGVTCNYVLKLSTNYSMICGILELNLSGNPIKQEVCSFHLLLCYVIVKLVSCYYACS